MVVCYSGHCSQPVYRCVRRNQMLGRPSCLAFGAKRVDTAIGREPLHAKQRTIGQQSEQRCIVELELPQARYDASLAE